MLIKVLPSKQQLLQWSRDIHGILWQEFAPHHFKEMKRLFDSHQWDFDPKTGEIRIGSGFGWRGQFAISGQPFRNTRTVEGTNHILDVGIRNQTQTATWYFVPFSADATPATTWTAANFNSNATEQTNYTEATRQAAAWAAAASSAIATSADTTITADTGGMTIFGAGLMSVNTKSATTGVLLAAGRLASSITYPAASTCDLSYTVTLS